MSISKRPGLTPPGRLSVLPRPKSDEPRPDLIAYIMEREMEGLGMEAPRAEDQEPPPEDDATEPWERETSRRDEGDIVGKEPLMPSPPHTHKRKPQGYKVCQQQAEMERLGAMIFHRHKSTKGLDIGVRTIERLEEVRRNSQQSGGTVTLVRHIPEDVLMAQKSFHLPERQDSVQKASILKELSIMNRCNSEFIIQCFGAYFSHHTCLNICMEYMDARSLDLVLKISEERIPEDILARTAWAVLSGIKYLKKELNIVHRDVKPSNILINSKGEIKLCDFGVAGFLKDRKLSSHVGTVTYMSPERLRGDSYSVKGDVWALGLSVLELLLGRFPLPHLTKEDFAAIFSVPVEAVGPLPPLRKPSSPGGRILASGDNMSFLDVYMCLNDQPPPILPDGLASPHITHFIRNSLEQCPKRRAGISALLSQAFARYGEGVPATAVQIWLKARRTRALAHPLRHQDDL